jgi:DNA-directed RNA polymerase subunit omega
MNKPTVDEMLTGLMSTLPEGEEKPNRYTIVMVAAKRARQINNYYRSLGDGGALDDYSAPPLMAGSRNLLSVAMEEVAAGEVGFRFRAPSS